MCTGGLASAVHVKFITTPVHSLLVAFVVKMIFSGSSAKQKHCDFYAYKCLLTNDPSNNPCTYRFMGQFSSSFKRE